MSAWLYAFHTATCRIISQERNRDLMKRSIKMLTGSLALAAALGGTSVQVLAAEPAKAASSSPSLAVDPERLAIAEQIIEIAFPPAERETRMHGLLGTMRDQFTASVDLNTVEDPGLRKIFEDYFESIPDSLKPAVNAFIPKQMDAMAHAYARMFTKAELEDVLAFAKTPNGATFLQHSIDVMSDPEVAAANTAYMKDVLALNQTMTADLKAKITAYMKEHPEAAKSK